METIFAVVFAFFFYLVLLPVYGLLVGICVRVLLPYGWVAMLITLLGLDPFWHLLSVAWIIALLLIRNRIGNQEEIHWSDGHYQSARALLTLGLS